jgi:hypothetical protein
MKSLNIFWSTGMLPFWIYSLSWIWNSGKELKCLGPTSQRPQKTLTEEPRTGLARANQTTGHSGDRTLHRGHRLTTAAGDHPPRGRFLIPSRVAGRRRPMQFAPTCLPHSLLSPLLISSLWSASAFAPLDHHSASVPLRVAAAIKLSSTGAPFSLPSPHHLKSAPRRPFEPYPPPTLNLSSGCRWNLVGRHRPSTMGARVPLFCPSAGSPAIMGRPKGGPNKQCNFSITSI